MTTRVLSVAFLALFTSIAAFAGAQLKCYPNPASAGYDEVKIEINPSDNGVVSLAIYTADGYLVKNVLESFTVRASGPEIVARWNMENEDGTLVKPGAYVVKLEGELGGEATVEKFTLIVGK